MHGDTEWLEYKGSNSLQYREAEWSDTETEMMNTDVSKTQSKGRYMYMVHVHVQHWLLHDYKSIQLLSKS